MTEVPEFGIERPPHLVEKDGLIRHVKGRQEPWTEIGEPRFCKD